MIIGNLKRWGVRKTVVSHWTCFFAKSSPKCFASSPEKPGYGATVPNLKIGSDTRVIVQGFTGRQATQHAVESIVYGTKIIGGVATGKMGEHLTLPLVPTVRVAQKYLRPDATVIYASAGQAGAAIEEAIEAEIPLIVALAEHVPAQDMLRIHSMLRSQSKSRLVGPDTSGMISAVGKCRLGNYPLSIFKPGCIGIVAKSAPLSYEAVTSTTRAGLGQSLVIDLGGDVKPGTSFVDALKIFEHDDDTRGIILVGEIGDGAEVLVADWVKRYHKRVKHPKPIMGIVAGTRALSDQSTDDAGTIVRRGDFAAVAKAKLLENAGVIIINHPSRFGGYMARLLSIPEPRSWRWI